MSALEELRALIDFLHHPNDPSALPQERQQELLLRGILSVLEEAAGIGGAAAGEAAGADASEAGGRGPAIAALRWAAAAHAHNAVREQAYSALVRLAHDGIRPAVDALYGLAVEDDRLAARQIITAEGWQPTRPTLRALFDWFAHLESGRPYPAENLSLLTQAYFEEASPALQRRLLATAGQNRAENWARIVSAAQAGTSAALVDLAGRYPSFSPEERQLVLEQLDRLASQGSPEARAAAREALSLLFISHEDQSARDLVLTHEYLPEDAEQRALFFFLAEAWNPYQSLDFDHNLLVNAYETAGRSLRRRLLEHARRTAQTQWLRGIGTTGEVRWLADLTDADWELARRRLLEQEKLADLWRLAQVAPPVWSAEILEGLAERGWTPPTEDERAGFEKLSALARECKGSPLALRPKKSLRAHCELAGLAIHPDGKFLAAGAGGSDQRIFLWDLPDGYPRSPLIGPAPVTRALAFSPDGELLAAAAGDHRIRVFRLQGGMVVKTLEGHRAMVRSLAIHPDGRTLASAGFDGSLRLWRFPYGPELKTIKPGPGEIFSMVMGAGGSHLISGGADNLVHVLTLPEGVSARELTGHLDTVTYLAASPSSEIAASAGRDGVVRVWNYTSGGLVRAIENPGAPLTALCLHANDQVLIGGRSSGEITLWSLSTGRVIDQPAFHHKPVIGLALSPEGDRLYSADTGGEIHAWDLRTFLTIRLPGTLNQPGAVQALQEILKNSALSPAEKKWLNFSVELARWKQRFDIELADFDAITVGEFDIEL